MDQDTIENTDGNYINMQVEELPYYRKDEDAYLKFPGDDDLENTFLPVLIPSPKKKKNKTKKYKKPKGRPKNTRVKSRIKVKSDVTLSANLRR